MQLIFKYLSKFSLLFFCLLPVALRAQVAPPPPAAQDSTKKIKVEYSDFGEYFLRGGQYLQKLSGNVRLRQENTLVYCDTATILADDAVLQGKVVMEQGDTVKVFADSAHYFGATRQSDLFGDVVLVNGRQQLFTDRLHYDLANKIATYTTGAVLHNGKSQLKSRRGRYDVNAHEIFFKGDVLVTDPDFTVRTDTMNFNTETQIVRFVAPTLISQRESKIYCESGFYDIENDFAEFDLNPQYERKDQRGRAKKMRYDGTTKEYTLEGDAYIEEKTQRVEADVVKYNTDTEVAVLIGNAHFRDSAQDITGERIRYDERQKKYQITGRSRVVDKQNIIVADSLDFNDELGSGLAVGNVVWVDTASDYTILAARMDYNKRSEFIEANGGFGGSKRPLMKSLIERDTLYMSAERLVSFKPDSTADTRLLLAFRDVRIFKSDLQAVCDSLSYSSADSVFRFYSLTNRQPLIWSDTSQFSADTIRMALKDKKLDKIWLRQNAFVINSEDELAFNQIKGRNCTATFRDDEVREMLVDGNAEAVYYALDDKRAYIGVNQSQCAEMRLFFGDNKVNSIKFYAQPKGSFTPMKKAPPGGTRLPGFFWETKRRPRQLADLF
ncbi:MAG: OstA-like protein [Saprospiraceae bacterium]